MRYTELTEHWGDDNNDTWFVATDGNLFANRTKKLGDFNFASLWWNQDMAEKVAYERGLSVRVVRILDVKTVPPKNPPFVLATKRGNKFLRKSFYVYVGMYTENDETKRYVSVNRAKKALQTYNNERDKYFRFIKKKRGGWKKVWRDDVDTETRRDHAKAHPELFIYSLEKSYELGDPISEDKFVIGLPNKKLFITDVWHLRALPKARIYVDQATAEKSLVRINADSQAMRDRNLIIYKLKMSV